MQFISFMGISIAVSKNVGAIFKETETILSYNTWTWIQVNPKLAPLCVLCTFNFMKNKYSKIPKGQTEIVKSEKTMANRTKKKIKHRTHNTTLIPKGGVTRTLQKPGWFHVLRSSKQLLSTIGTLRVT